MHTRHRRDHGLIQCFPTRGGARHFHLEGPLEGPVLQQGELSVVCVGLLERDLKNFGARQNFRGSGPLGTPLAPPLFPTVLGYSGTLLETNKICGTQWRTHSNFR